LMYTGLFNTGLRYMGFVICGLIRRIGSLFSYGWSCMPPRAS
jgi:hypothetical protein